MCPKDSGSLDRGTGVFRVSDLPFPDFRVVMEPLTVRGIPGYPPPTSHDFEQTFQMSFEGIPPLQRRLRVSRPPILTGPDLTRVNIHRLLYEVFTDCSPITTVQTGTPVPSSRLVPPTVQ